MFQSLLQTTDALGRWTVSGCDLPRIREIRDCTVKHDCLGTYFENFDASVVAYPVKYKHFLHLESELADLDAAAWAQLKAQVVPLFQKRDPVRGWQAAFDKLNEAKAFGYLARLGCTELAFIPESSIPGRKTPDLTGRMGSKSVLCEVKTTNPSDDEANARGRMIARSIKLQLSEASFSKLTSTLEKAKTQIDSFCWDFDARKVV